MALTALNDDLFWPNAWSPNVNISVGNLLLDAAGEKVAVVIGTFPRDAIIRKVGFKLGAITTGWTADFRVETVGGSGDPSGTLWAANTNASVVIADTDDNILKISDVLTADATIPAGSAVAFVLPWNTGGNGNVQFQANIFGMTPFALRRYADHFTAAWAKQTTGPPLLYLEDSAGNPILVPSVFPTSARTETAYNSGSTPDERGNRILMPMTMRCIGVWAFITGAAAADFDLVLYDTNGTTVLGTDSLDADHVVSQSGVQHGCFDPVTLNSGSVYRCAIKPTTVTNITGREVTVAAAAHMAALPGGTGVYSTTRTDAGAWTDDATKRTWCGLIIDQIDIGAAGGMLVHPGMSGGMRG